MVIATLFIIRKMVKKSQISLNSRTKKGIEIHLFNGLSSNYEKELAIATRKSRFMMSLIYNIE